MGYDDTGAADFSSSIARPAGTGFTIKFFDSVGTVVSRTFDWTAKGYGELAS